MQLQVRHPQERLPANFAHVVPALVDHPPVLPHLAALGEGGAAVRTEDIPEGPFTYDVHTIVEYLPPPCLSTDATSPNYPLWWTLYVNVP